MKFGYLLMALLLLQLNAAAQHSISGKIIEKESRLPVPNAYVSISNESGITDAYGNFAFRGLRAGEHFLTVSSVGYKTVKLSVNPLTSSVLELELEKIHLMLQPIEIKAVRAGERNPFTKSNLSKREIEKLNSGRDLPFILNELPSVVVNSDAGNGVGYTSMRIRGTDATRINVTINGIPYNDAESQGSFFVNMPDFASSVNNIQVQRGVGTSSNGAGAFGATINMSTNEFIEDAYAEVNNSYGSFNTWKNTVKAGTGLIDGKFTVDARLSSITSDGYIERASSDLKSFYLSGAYFIGKDASLRLNIISGKEKTYHAWNGVTEDMLATNRRYNSAGTEKPGTPYENETDNYKQDHYQLFYNHSLNEKWKLNTALFLTRGKGYYEQYKAGRSYASFGLPNYQPGDTVITKTDIVRQLHLDNYYYGGIFSLQYKARNTEWITGGGWNRYDGTHFGRIPWSLAGGIPKDYEWYNLEARKTDLNIYSKLQHGISEHWNIFGDLQYRYVTYRMDGFRDNPDLYVDKTYHFLNPKAGISYQHSGWTGYLSYALANKEPNRDDFEAGAQTQPKHETLHDLELGVGNRMNQFNWEATFYYMQYRNQLVLTGIINDVGAYTRTNIPDSYRAGIELQARWRPVYWGSLSGNMALSRNKIKDYTTWYDDWDNGGQKAEIFEETDISFSPSVVAGVNLSVNPVKRMEISFIGKYVGKQYLDNTSNSDRMLTAFYVQDARISYQIPHLIFKELGLMAQVNNLFSKKYEPNGYTYSYIYEGRTVNENYYYPMAGINFTVGLNIKL